MPTPVIEEQKAKAKRILELHGAKLNTPRMCFIQQGDAILGDGKVAEWTKKVHEEDPEQKFNIRTYMRLGTKEAMGCPHVCDIPFDDVLTKLSLLLTHYHCMVDAETPDNGRLAGNIMVEVNPLGRPVNFTAEFVEKENRAMVRDIQNEKATIVKGTIPPDRTLPFDHKIMSVVERVIRFYAVFIPRENLIFEWTWFKGPAGFLHENLVFWEYRRAE